MIKFIGIIVAISIVSIIIYIFKADGVDPEELSARDYWRWKNGGID